MRNCPGVTEVGRRHPYYQVGYSRRRRYVVDLLKDEPRLEEPDVLGRVVAAFEVDERTARRDIDALREEGLVRRTRPHLAAATDVEAATTRAMKLIDEAVGVVGQGFLEDLTRRHLFRWLETP